MKLVRKTTNEVLTDVKRRQYPNRLGYSFGGSVGYIGKDVAGNKVELSSRELSRYVEGFSIGDTFTTWNDDKATITELAQVTKNTVAVVYLIEGDDKQHFDTFEGRIVDASR